VVTFIDCLSHIFWVMCCSFCVSISCFTLHFYVLETPLSLNLKRQPLLTLNVSSSSLSAFIEFKRVIACPGLGFGLWECSGWFDLLIPRHLKLSPQQQLDCFIFHNFHVHWSRTLNFL
jgi:hypothetical protein